MTDTPHNTTATTVRDFQTNGPQQTAPVAARDVTEAEYQLPLNHPFWEAARERHEATSPAIV